MKVLNVSESTVILDDINVTVIYSRQRVPQDIPDAIAKRSQNLRLALHRNMLVDVTAGIPEKLPVPDEIRALEPSPDSPYFKKQGMLSRDAHADAPLSVKSPKKVAKSAIQEFKETGKMSVVWTGPACFPPGAFVLTDQGVKEIKDIKVGDHVFTCKGRLRKVVRKYERSYEGEMVRMKCALDSEDIVLTPYHHVVVVRGKECKRRRGHGYVCKPSCNTQHNIFHRKYGDYESCVHGWYKNYVIDKVSAGDLTKLDFLIMPKLTCPETMTEIRLDEWQGSYIKFSNNDEYIWASPRPQASCKTSLAKKHGISVNWLYNPARLSKENEKICVDILEQDEPFHEQECEQGNKIPLTVKLDRDFGRLIGLYLAEGSSSDGDYGGAASCGTIGFALHEDEKETAKFIADFLSNRLGLRPKIHHESGGKKGQSVFGYNIIFGNFLKNSCGADCYSKRIPPFTFSAPEEFITGLILGYWEGDGTKYARIKDNSLKIGSASPSLTYGLRLLLSKFGITGSIHLETRSEAVFKGKIYKYDPPSKFYLLRISGRQLYENAWLSNLPYNTLPHTLKKHNRERQYYSDEDNSYLKINELSKESYSGMVYDLEVEEDHTYLVYGKAFSNSDFGGYARMNRKFMSGLTDMGVDVCHESIPSLNDIDKKTAEQLRKFQTTRVPNDAIKVYGQTAPLIYDWSRHKMLYTMLETRFLHKDYTIRCNCSDEIVVPSHWCLHEFKDSGVKVPISVVPIGVDTSIYRPGIEPLSFSKPLKDFVFLSVFGWSLRKGYDVLLKAYLEEFTSDDPVSLLISSRYFGSTDESKKKVIRDDVAKISTTIQNPRKPHVVLFGDCLSDAAMPRIFAAADCYVLISRGEGFGMPYCFVGGSKIYLPNKIKNIENIKTGDTVISHSGKERRVIRTFEREYRGPLIKIKALSNNRPVPCTPEHMFFVVRKRYEHANDVRHLNHQPEWIMAKNLKKGDLLVVPIPIRQPCPRQTLDLATFIDCRTYDFDTTHIWSHYSNRSDGISADKLAELSGVSKRQVYRVMQLKQRGISKEKRQVVLDVMNNCGFDDNSVVKINRFVNVDEEFAELAGLYAAEGCAMSTGVSFSYHARELGLHKRTKDLVSKIFGNIKYWERHKGNKYEIVFSSSIFARIMERLVGKGALHKQLCDEIFNAEESIRMAFVRAEHAGDGHTEFKKESTIITYSSSSEMLIVQVWQILLANGILASFIQKNKRINKNTAIEYILQFTIKRKNAERQRSEYIKTVHGDGFFLAPIKKIESEPFDGKVYNLEVEDENSYCVNGFAVHNCEAPACNIPVIASRYSGHTDFLNDDNSYLVDVDGFKSAEKSLAWISYFYENAEFPIFGPKAVEQTRHHMRHVFENRDEAQIKSDKLHKKIVEEYNWTTCVKQMHDKLKETYGRLSNEKKP